MYRFVFFVQLVLYHTWNNNMSSDLSNNNEQRRMKPFQIHSKFFLDYFLRDSTPLSVHNAQFDIMHIMGKMVDISLWYNNIEMNKNYSFHVYNNIQIQTPQNFSFVLCNINNNNFTRGTLMKLFYEKYFMVCLVYPIFFER